MNEGCCSITEDSANISRFPSNSSRQARLHGHRKRILASISSESTTSNCMSNNFSISHPDLPPPACFEPPSNLPHLVDQIDMAPWELHLEDLRGASDYQSKQQLGCW
jgi:hypothetical protein